MICKYFATSLLNRITKLRIESKAVDAARLGHGDKRVTAVGFQFQAYKSKCRPPSREVGHARWWRNILECGPDASVHTAGRTAPRRFSNRSGAVADQRDRFEVEPWLMVVLVF